MTFKDIPANGWYSSTASNISQANFDIVGGYVEVTSTAIVAKMVMRNLPATLPFNQTGLPEDVAEYLWRVEFDTNNDGQADYSFGSTAYKFVSQPVNKTIDAGTQTNAWTEQGNSSSYLRSATVALTRESNTLVWTVSKQNNPLSAITSASKVRFKSYGTYPTAESVQGSATVMDFL